MLPVKFHAGHEICRLNEIDWREINQTRYRETDRQKYRERVRDRQTGGHAGRRKNRDVNNDASKSQINCLFMEFNFTSSDGRGYSQRNMQMMLDVCCGTCEGEAA